MASPVPVRRSAAGEVIGTLSLICVERANPVDYVLAQHLLSQTADRIEARLFARAYSSSHVMAPAPGAPRGALLALNDTSTIVAATRAAAEMGPNPGYGVFGKTLGEAFQSDVPVVDLPGRIVSVGPTSGRLTADLREIAGEDPAVNRAVAESERLLARNMPVMIEGSSGCGKKQLAEAFLRNSRKSVRYLDCMVVASTVDPAGTVSAWVRETDWFLEKGADIALLLSQLEVLPPKAEALLAAWLTKHDRDGGLRGEQARFKLVATGTTGGDYVYLSAAGSEVGISAEALQSMADYDWPGSFRELENVLTGIVTLHGRGDIEMAQLPQHIAHPAQPATAIVPDIEGALAQSKWNVSRAARLMGISRATINRRIKDAGLTRPSETQA